jgi:hypothetical protein
MPVVGEPSQFAVEYDLNENYGGVWMFGRFCYWCGGQRVGDYEMSTSLRDVLFQLDQIAKYKLRANRRFSMMLQSKCSSYLTQLYLRQLYLAVATQTTLG